MAKIYDSTSPAGPVMGNGMAAPVALHRGGRMDPTMTKAETRRDQWLASAGAPRASSFVPNGYITGCKRAPRCEPGLAGWVGQLA